MRRAGGGQIGRVAAGLLAALLLALILAQLLLPGIAADHIRSRVGRYGQVLSVSVSAWPAIELLWGHADSVHVQTGPLKLSPQQAVALLWEARNSDSLEVGARRVALGGLTVSDVTLVKHGSRLRAGAQLGAPFVREALPAGVRVRLLASTPAGVLVRVSGGLFGAGGSLQALASGESGKLVVRPLAPALAGSRVTLFSDPRVQIEGVGAQAIGGPPEEPPGYALTLYGRLR